MTTNTDTQAHGGGVEAVREAVLSALKQAASGGACGLADYEIEAIADDLLTTLAASPAAPAPAAGVALTPEELQAVYAGPHYEAAINLVFGSQDGMTIGEVRDKLRALLATPDPDAKGER